MKRLLAAGSGPIYQIARVFRDGELGGRHQPEFTMVEWYRPGFDHRELIDEVGALVCDLLGVSRWDVKTYTEVFVEHLGIDPFEHPSDDLSRVASAAGVPIPMSLDDGHRNAWLDLLLSVVIEPRLGMDAPLFVVDYPPSQAALARIGGDQRPVAERFELYIHGVEIANGYHELADPREHRLRFREANVQRAGERKETLPVDEDFLAALEHGLPDCSGVALGFDRLLMVALGVETIADVLPFPFRR
jgi:lysyl-tRNA synthetase class 2